MSNFQENQSHETEHIYLYIHINTYVDIRSAYIYSIHEIWNKELIVSNFQGDQTSFGSKELWSAKIVGHCIDQIMLSLSHTHRHRHRHTHSHTHTHKELNKLVYPHKHKINNSNKNKKCNQVQSIIPRSLTSHLRGKLHVLLVQMTLFRLRWGRS